MPKNVAIKTFVKENRGVLAFVAVFLFILELKIFMVAAFQSGEKSTLQVFNANDQLIYTTDGKKLSDFNKYYFEKTFGPFEDYTVRLVTREVPFPFRAWLVASLGVPIGIVLLLGFIVKALATLFGGSERNAVENNGATDENNEAPFGLIDRVSQLNIFVIGMAIFFVLLLFWILPNAIAYVGELGINTLIRLRWLFGLLLILATFVVAWFLYLKYLLAKKTIDAQNELNKYRLALEFDHADLPRLENHGRFDRHNEMPAVDYKEERD